MRGPGNLDKIAAFLWDNEGTWYCCTCISGQTGIVPASQIGQLIRSLSLPQFGFELLARQLCDSCGVPRICIRARPSQWQS